MITWSVTSSSTGGMTTYTDSKDTKNTGFRRAFRSQKKQMGMGLKLLTLLFVITHPNRSLHNSILTYAKPDLMEIRFRSTLTSMLSIFGQKLMILTNSPRTTFLTSLIRHRAIRSQTTAVHRLSLSSRKAT